MSDKSFSRNKDISKQGQYLNVVAKRDEKMVSQKAVRTQFTTREHECAVKTPQQYSEDKSDTKKPDRAPKFDPVRNEGSEGSGKCFCKRL